MSADTLASLPPTPDPNVESANDRSTGGLSESHTPPTAVHTSGPAPTETISRNLAGSITATAILAFLGLLLETVVGVLFPALMETFGIGMGAVSWMTTGYLLVVSLTMPLSGFLQRRFTARSLFMTAALVVFAGAIIAATAQIYPVLLAGRILQGVGTGISTPLMFSIIMMQAPRAKVGMLMGVGALVLGSAPALGPTLGGVIGTMAGWRVVFWMTLPLLAVAAVVGWRSIQQVTPTSKAPLAFGQLILLAIGLIGLVLGIEQLGSLLSGGTQAAVLQVVVSIALVVLGLASLAWFAMAARRSSNPLLQLSVLRDRGYTWSLLAFCCLQFVALGLGYLLPNYVQLALGRTSLVGGLLVLPGAIVGAALAPVAGSLFDKFGAKLPITIGVVTALVATVAMALFGVKAGVVGLSAFYLVFMFGFALCFANSQTNGMAKVRRELTPDATAMMSTCQQFAAAVAMTVLSTIIAVNQTGLAPGSTEFQAGTTSGAGIAFWVIVALVAAALAAELRAFASRKA
ncbi:MFS transporter [Propionimicrobium sp. PCR01-08-3]|uniref:MFS transporter n=1 Tax=Propionimicrobium sp. PCR01-08-3 TaxID=3052086 RepID=UPI00255C7F0B|nr:MFS transporter [Propionimicrobium sp. PCR01-08-3]WIY82486.1 MFS transporter [Propionimicrobium sp. PCR01-08-3]